MEIVSFFIGVFLGVISLSMNRIKLLIRIILSIGTSYLFLLIIYPSFSLWNLDNMKWKNVYSNFQYKSESILGFVFSILIFYILFPLVINLILSKKSIKKSDSFFFSLNDSGTRKLKLLCHRLVKCGIKIKLRLGLSFNKNVKNENIIDYKNLLISTCSIIIHFLVCWVFILGFPSLFISLLMFSIFCFLLLNIFLTPFLKNIFFMRITF